MYKIKWDIYVYYKKKKLKKLYFGDQYYEL